MRSGSSQAAGSANSSENIAKGIISEGPLRLSRMGGHTQQPSHALVWLAALLSLALACRSESQVAGASPEGALLERDAASLGLSGPARAELARLPRMQRVDRCVFAGETAPPERWFVLRVERTTAHDGLTGHLTESVVGNVDSKGCRLEARAAGPPRYHKLGDFTRVTDTITVEYVCPGFTGSLFLEIRSDGRLLSPDLICTVTSEKHVPAEP